MKQACQIEGGRPANVCS